MVRVKRDVLERYLVANANMDSYDDASKKFIRKSDASFKYTGGPSYRPDIAGPVRWAWEIRNAHKDTAGLKAKVLRDLAAHSYGLAPYKGFSQVPAFDSVNDFARLPAHVQKALRVLFPSKADPRFHYNADELLSLEMFRNFAFPNSDVTPLIHQLAPGLKESFVLSKSVAAARLAYVNKLSDISLALEARQMDVPTARAQVMGALAIWAVDSGLSDAFEATANRLQHDSRYATPEAQIEALAI